MGITSKPAWCTFCFSYSPGLVKPSCSRQQTYVKFTPALCSMPFPTLRGVRYSPTSLMARVKKAFIDWSPVRSQCNLALIWCPWALRCSSTHNKWRNLVALACLFRSKGLYCSSWDTSSYYFCTTLLQLRRIEANFRPYPLINTTL